MERPLRIALVELTSPGLHIFSAMSLPRLGTVLLGTILRDLGHEVDVQVEEVRPLDEDAMRKADLVGISTITPTASSSFRLADRLRADGIPVVLGGPHVTWMPDEGMQHADYVIRGEGEEGLPALVVAIAEGRTDLSHVPGLTWRRPDGEVVTNALAKPVDLDTLPSPDLDLLGFTPTRVLGLRRVVPIQISRGCPFDCSFCTVHTTFGRKMRYRSIDRVLDDLERLDGPNLHVFFYDDNFVVSKKRTKELLRAMIERRFQFRWSAQVRTDIGKDPELLELMARSNCYNVYVGLESVNEQALASMRKRQNLGAMSEHIRNIRSAGINVHGMFVLGFDEDDEATLEATVDFGCRCGITSVQFLLLTPLPGSETWRDLSAAGRLRTRTWDLYDTFHVVFAPEKVSPDQLQQAQCDGHLRFYSWRRVLANALRGDFRFVVITLYARFNALSWAKKNTHYLAALRRLGITDRVETWASAFDEVPVTGK